jgi:hypothetical protein
MFPWTLQRQIFFTRSVFLLRKKNPKNRSLFFSNERGAFCLWWRFLNCGWGPISIAMTEAHRAVKSKWNRIVFCYRIECFCSNRIKSYPNWIEWFFRFSIRFDSILTKSWTWKTINCDRKKRKIHKTESWRGLSDIDAFIMHNFLKIGHFPNRQYSFMTADAFSYRIESFFESNRYRIEIESNRTVSATSRSKIESNRNWFDLTALEAHLSEKTFWLKKSSDTHSPHLKVLRSSGTVHLLH